MRKFSSDAAQILSTCETYIVLRFCAVIRRARGEEMLQPHAGLLASLNELFDHAAFSASFLFKDCISSFDAFKEGFEKDC